MDKKTKVLLVDDEAILRDSVSEWLRGDNYHVECAENGEDALKLAQTTRFDTAVVDLKMPGIDGFQVLDRLRSSSPDTKVIIITAYGTIDTAVDAMKRGAVEFLSKPFTPDVLEKAIDKSASGAVVMEPAKEAVLPATVEVRKAKEKQCVWAKAGVISARVCTSNYKCDSCEFSLQLIEEGGGKDPLADAIKKMLEKPGCARACRYMLSGDVSHRLCTNLYKCEMCEFEHNMSERKEVETEKMVRKMKAMRDRKASGKP